MITTCIDLEWTITKKEWKSTTSGRTQNYIDNTAYYPDNKLVSIGYRTSSGEQGYLFFNHKEVENTPEDMKKLFDHVQSVLDKTTLLVAYNAQSDLTWLREYGFKYEGQIYDPMAFEYAISYGLKTPLSLKEVVKKYGLEDKSDVLSKYYAEGKNTDEIPLTELLEYGKQDVKLLVDLFQAQKQILKSDDKVASMKPALRLMNEFLPVITDMARAGIRIHSVRLMEIEEDYRRKLAIINTRISEIVREVMGATPVNMDSPEQLSQLFYSFKVNDKKEWTTLFNIGTEIRNGVVKKKYPYDMTDKEVYLIVKQNTTEIKKTKARQCQDCLGKGYATTLKKDGTPSKANRICKICDKKGIVYEELDERAGLGLMPPGSKFASDGGFSTSSDAIALMAKDKSMLPIAREFLELLEQRNAITMYLSTFVEGIQKHMHRGIVHMEYAQYMTATGRLTSRFHNIPKGKTFPVKEAIISKFKEGVLLNVDFAQLEFRGAATQANDQVAIQDILDSVDVHTNTMNALIEAGEPTDRDGAKSRTFKPLYGGQTGTKAEIAYYEWFLNRYSGIRDWQLELGEQACVRHWNQTPSTRIYEFPHAVKQRNGRIKGFTQIANYSVQGFSSDIVMACIIEINKNLREAGCKSHLIMTIHDSFVIDTSPDEIKDVVEIIKKTLDNVQEIIDNRFNYKLRLPLAYEISIGYTWGQQKTLYKGK